MQPQPLGGEQGDDGSRDSDSRDSDGDAAQEQGAPHGPVARRTRSATGAASGSKRKRASDSTGQQKRQQGRLLAGQVQEAVPAAPSTAITSSIADPAGWYDQLNPLPSDLVNAMGDVLARRQGSIVRAVVGPAGSPGAVAKLFPIAKHDYALPSFAAEVRAYDLASPVQGVAVPGIIAVGTMCDGLVGCLVMENGGKGQILLIRNLCAGSVSRSRLSVSALLSL